jgi:hypothetical protein
MARLSTSRRGPLASQIALGLRRNIVCIDLAKAIYAAHAAYRGALAPNFYDLSPAERHVWVERAKATILTVPNTLTQEGT